MHTLIGKYILFTGLILVVAVIVIYFFGDKLRWIGHLPGDIRIEKENVRVYIPITTMILASVLLTFLVHFIRKFF
jgi:hypothetical protein